MTSDATDVDRYLPEIATAPTALMVLDRLAGPRLR
jgi:hypothetical protein